MAECGRIPVPLRLCRGCRQFVRLGHVHCVFCGADLDAREAEHEADRAELRRAADALRRALAERGIEPPGAADRP